MEDLVTVLEAGDPVLIRRDVQGFLGGEVTNGRLLYHSVAETKRVYTMAIELASGRILSEPVPVPGTGWHSGPQWSPDGERLAFVRHIASASSGSGQGSVVEPGTQKSVALGGQAGPLHSTQGALRKIALSPSLQSPQRKPDGSQEPVQAT